MFDTVFLKSTVLLNQMIEKDQNFIVDWVSTVLGYILTFLFNIIYNFTTVNALGLAIILLTVVARTIMLPMAFKQQKSMVAMRKLAPEQEKIKQKYGNTKDPELQKKMNAEVQALYTKNKVNPLSGCLPLFITFPIFIALSYLMRHTYLYVRQLGDIYNEIGMLVQNIDGIKEMLIPLIVPKVQGTGIQIDITVLTDLAKAFNKFTAADWSSLLSGVSGVSASTAEQIQTLLTKKSEMENFLGIDIVEIAGWSFPGVIIPILTGITTFLSSWIMNLQQKSSDPSQKTTQTVMLVAMPVMMTWMTTSMSVGVGIYWITSSVYQTIQQILLNNYYTKNSNEIIVNEKQAKEIIEIKNAPKNKKGVK